jgi:hypothetical protein
MKKGYPMNPKTKLVVMLALLALLTASCTPKTPSVVTDVPKDLTATPAATPEATYVIVPNTSLPTVQPATATPETLATATIASTPGNYSPTAYLDDRSTPAAVVLSFANAINRHEYLRAYSYWQDAGTYLGSLASFTSSMENVANETVTMGQVVTEGAAGSSYYTIPAAVTDTLDGGGTNKYAVCYVLRMPQPGNYGAPPIQPMHFYQQTKLAVDVSISDANVIAAACSETSGLPSAPAVLEDLANISSSNFIDNRSGAVEVVKSLLNAINRKEYVRAYSYFQDPSTFPGSYSSYAAGFSDTASVTAVFGTVTSDAGAGQFYYQVPVAETVTTTSSTTQLFVGCYTLHLANPGMQGTLPFEPLGIKTGHFTSYPSGTDVAPLLATACN